MLPQLKLYYSSPEPYSESQKTGAMLKDRGHDAQVKICIFLILYFYGYELYSTEILAVSMAIAIPSDIIRELATFRCSFVCYV